MLRGSTGSTAVTRLLLDEEADGYRARDTAAWTFNVTRNSIGAIERCLGLSTCGEGATEEMKQEPLGEPPGDCPHGHQEAAFEFMLNGIRPTEPCPQCGEIPEFGNMWMSPDLHPDGRVKGVDGQEHSTCPACGDDTLQLKGSSVVEWGWEDCVPELRMGDELAESLDINQYCGLMEEVKAKIEAINQLIDVPGLTIRTRVESVCLQLRMLLELIVFSSLVSNKDVWRKSQKELQSSQDISKKLRELRSLHPDFYPKPVTLDAAPSGEEPPDRTEDFLTEGELTKVYGMLGNILHAENPMGKETDYRFFIGAVPDWLSLVQNLLECHKVYLYHRPEEFYLIKMFGDVDGKLIAIRFKTSAKGKTKCAWPDCVSSSNRLYCEYVQVPWKECRLPEIEPAQKEGKSVADVLDDAAATS